MEKDKKESLKMDQNVIVRKDRGIDAFVLSIISILSTFFWYISLPAGIYALVRGIIATKKSGSKLAKASFIISLIALTICFAIYTQTIFAIILFT